MKKFVSVIAICLITAPVLAATPTAQSRRSMRGQMVMSAPRTVATTDTVASDVADDSSSDARATASVKQINAIAAANTGVATTDKSSIRVEPTKDSVSESEEDTREKERLACISNNIGVGNTFVWASRYSNTANYATMVEDIMYVL